MNREAGIRLSVWTAYTYTLETLFQAAEMGLRVQSIPIRVQLTPPVRSSRLFSSPWHYCWNSFKTLLVTIVRYRSFSTFLIISGLSFTAAGLLGLRFLWSFLHGYNGRIQSLILCAILAVSGLSFFLASILGETISLNRRLLEQLRYDQRKRLLPPSV